MSSASFLLAAAMAMMPRDNEVLIGRDGVVETVLGGGRVFIVVGFGCFAVEGFGGLVVVGQDLEEFEIEGLLLELLGLGEKLVEIVLADCRGGLGRALRGSGAAGGGTAGSGAGVLGLEAQDAKISDNAKPGSIWFLEVFLTRIIGILLLYLWKIPAS